MPIKESAKKALRQSIKHALRNAKARRVVKTLIKDAKTLIVAKEKSAVEKVKEAIIGLDKAAQKGIIKKNAAARRKSRLMKKLNSTK
ncbi:MAG: 30S ribosomal protein S20 [bacterium]